MTTGESNFVVSGRKVQRYDNTPIPAGKYELKLLATEAKVDKKPEPGKLPYISVPFEVLGTGKDGGKNRRYYHNFFLKTDPEKNGRAMVDWAGGITDFAQAAGIEAIPAATTETTDTEGQTVTLLSPTDVLNFIKTLDGAVVNAQLKIEIQKDGKKRSRVAHFIADTSTSGL